MQSEHRTREPDLESIEQKFIRTDSRLGIGPEAFLVAIKDNIDSSFYASRPIITFLVTHLVRDLESLADRD